MKTDWSRMQQLFPAYLEGAPGATRELFTSISSALKGFFHARLGPGTDAEDLVQATLLKIHFARERFDESQSLKTWVFTIAGRSLIDHYREAGQEAEHFETPETAIDAPADTLSPEEKSQLNADLEKALSVLKPIDRSIVYLYGVEGLSMAEIAATLKLTEGAAKLRAHRAYVELRKTLGSTT